MWPTPTHRPGTPSGWSTLGPRARILLVLGVIALVASVAVTTWLSIRVGPSSTPVYETAGGAPSAIWTWDGSTFEMASVAGAGPASNDADMAYDRARGVLLLWDHGCSRLVMGFTGGCAERVDQTWAWDGRRWSPRSPRSSPVEVGQGAMLYDARLARVVYVNGAGQAWSWTGSDWQALPMSGAPRVPGRGAAAPSAFAAGYDEGRGLLVLALSSATWTWDGATWTEASGGIDVDEARKDAHLVYDGAHDQLVYVGSRFTWTWNGAGWQRHDQPAIASGTLAYDAVRRQVLLVEQDSSACDLTACRTTTWTWDSRSWTQLAAGQTPMLPLSRSGASLPPMAFDEGRGVAVLFASGS